MKIGFFIQKILRNTALRYKILGAQKQTLMKTDSKNKIIIINNFKWGSSYWQILSFG